MNKFFPYRSLLAPVLALLAVACADPMQPAGGDGVPDHCIELTLSNLHPTVQTKADDPTIAGEDAYNENLVRNVDCFFYRNGQTDQPAVFQALGRSVMEENGSLKVRIFYTDGNAEAMFSSTESGTCQVYVICNSPLIYGNNTSVSALQNMIAESDFSAQVIQPSFLMPAVEPATVTLTTDQATGNRTASGSVLVKRSAAKVQMYFMIASKVVDDLNQDW